jgi:hypothetical protein
MSTFIGIITMAGIVLLLLLANSYIGFTSFLRSAGAPSTTLVTA